jgi:predicted nuclease of predicted toxin-antitoxin system
MIGYYFDVHVSGIVFQMLKEKGLDIIRAQDDGYGESEDEKLLERATELGRILVTGDKDFIEISKKFQEQNHCFSGILFFRPTQITLKILSDDLFLIAYAARVEELSNQIIFLPL